MIVMPISPAPRHKPELLAMTIIILMPIPRVLFLMAFVVVAFSANVFRRVHNGQDVTQ